ncbi:hypothetical protein [Occallatibacter savannae]|uniref:hypothetical protein n=1 Tax=Occallatibacter savannae TaxID=1002691 RepID=UPI000D68B45B|nr:hypothetical protein [Occallatibacter savannae]
MHVLAIILQENQQLNPEMIQKLVMFIIPMMLVGYLIAILLFAVPSWFILKKAGFSPWLSLLCIVPTLGTVVLLFILAFAEWKVVPNPQAAVMPPPYPPPPPPYPPQA